MCSSQAVSLSLLPLFHFLSLTLLFLGIHLNPPMPLSPSNCMQVQGHGMHSALKAWALPDLLAPAVSGSSVSLLWSTVTGSFPGAGLLGVQRHAAGLPPYDRLALGKLPALSTSSFVKWGEYHLPYRTPWKMKCDDKPKCSAGFLAQSSSQRVAAAAMTTLPGYLWLKQAVSGF